MGHGADFLRRDRVLIENEPPSWCRIDQNEGRDRHLELMGAKNINKTGWKRVIEPRRQTDLLGCYPKRGHPPTDLRQDSIYAIWRRADGKSGDIDEGNSRIRGESAAARGSLEVLLVRYRAFLVMRIPCIFVAPRSK